ncbi:MAG: UbiD family decarboxylase [Saprospiraceae bacterium]|nr:UbiD family decarboxylase [Saprospiraceae bacterium]MBK7220938.1 UbiD family decarboxylase [Saprospiraceae bacterium]MBK9688243.1 UbiD family decarboxylase [Saprospiraceae bacterium]
MHRSLKDAAIDLEKSGQLIRVKEAVSGHLEAAEIHRRVFDAAGPAILFEKIEGSPFMALSNLYGTFERTRYLFRDTLRKVQQLMEIKANPANALKRPFHYLPVLPHAIKALPLKSYFKPPIYFGKTSISQLPLIKSWPMDGGAFVTMPQVFTLPPAEQHIMKSNIGMYRIQLNGNEYKENEEIGLHYQLHRGIGIHHQMYNNSPHPFKCSVFVGGPPAHAFSAIMPMPENLSELTMAGLLAGRRFRYWTDPKGHTLSSDADFVITGIIQKDLKKEEGPFGDHLGYYSLTHDFPFMKVDDVYHKKDAIWHFTVVGRPPQEDSSFGYLIHEIVKDLTPQEFPGATSIHAVDAAGVHPLLLATAKDRYMPFRERVPEEILTIANRIIGSGQTSLAKFLLIAADEDDAPISAKNIPAFFHHLLQRIDWRRDLHFFTKTTIDTLDYSGNGWNAGSKVIMACRGPVIRNLGTELSELPSHQLIQKISCPAPGVLALQLPTWKGYDDSRMEITTLTDFLKQQNLSQFPLIVLCDDAHFLSSQFNNFLWVTFTRANPATDLYGVGEFTQDKHWGCTGSLIIDARIKSHHAPILEADQKISSKVDSLFKKGGSLYGCV